MATKKKVYKGKEKVVLSVTILTTQISLDGQEFSSSDLMEKIEVMVVGDQRIRISLRPSFLIHTISYFVEFFRDAIFIFSYLINHISSSAIQTIMFSFSSTLCI